MRLILLGAPGAGKGSQGALLAKKHGLARIATGDLLRDTVRQGTPLGQKAKKYMEAGELVPDELILAMVREVLAHEGNGFVLDGFPRTLEQARGLDRMLQEMETGIDAVIVFRVPDEVLIKRLSGRRSCPECNTVYNSYFDPPDVQGVCDRCGSKLMDRADDDPETVKHRLTVYARQTRPLIDYYQKAGTRVEFIRGDQSVNQVQDAILEVLIPA
ncbi:MAG: adenylate kinase [Gemmatimonadota bacterium]